MWIGDRMIIAVFLNMLRKLLQFIGWKLPKSICLWNQFFKVLVPNFRISSSWIWTGWLWDWIINADDNSVIIMAENAQVKRQTVIFLNNTSFLWLCWMWRSASFQLLIYIVVAVLKWLFGGRLSGVSEPRKQNYSAETDRRKRQFEIWFVFIFLNMVWLLQGFRG